METSDHSFQTQYREDGFLIRPSPVLSGDLIRRASEGMDALLAGEYETGVSPQPSRWNPGDDPQKLGKIEMPQLANRAIHEVISHPEIGRFAAQLLRAEWVQVWWVQLLHKPAADSNTGSGVSVGWHQDRNYWGAWENGSELFTAWIAISDVTSDAGPMSFVRGSHRWGLVEGGDFYGGDLELQKERIPVPTGDKWEQVDAVLPPGGFSVHDCLVLHGSGPNLSGAPRRSFAVHLRTEKSRPVDNGREGLTRFIHNHDYCPVIYGNPKD